VKPPSDTVIASLVTIDASATIGFEALGNAFTIDNAGAGNVVDVVDTTFATAVVVADDDTVVDGESTVGLVVVAVVVVGAIVVGVVVVGVVVVGAEPALGASTSAASRINQAAAELGAIVPDAALLVPTATH
jgi:hypothetical protein